MMCGQAVQRRERRQQKSEEDAGDSLAGYALSRLPLEKQVEAIVNKLGVVSYSRQLKKKLPVRFRTHGYDDKLIALLREYAVLVCGNWVIKSIHLGYDGLKAYARDMLLCMLDK